MEDAEFKERRERMKYYIDGKLFDTEKEAINYEAELMKAEKERNEKRIKLEADIKNAKEAVDKAFEDYKLVSKVYSEALNTYIKLEREHSHLYDKTYRINNVFDNNSFGFWNNILDRRWE